MRLQERWPLPRWALRLNLVVFAVALFIIVGLIWRSTNSAKTGLCSIANGSPLTSFSYPSEAFVFTAIGAYIAGHITSRYVAEVRPELAADLGQDRFQRNGLVLVVKLITTGFLLAMTVINIVEAVALSTEGAWPITYYVWCATAAGPALSLFGAATVSFLVGRWLWVAK